MDSLTQRAVAAACAVAEMYGLRFDAPELVNAGINVLVRLAPTDVVCRVATTTGHVRHAGIGLWREVGIASYLAAQGLPVIPPSPALPAGPHEQDELWLSFWDYLPATDEPIDAFAAACALRACHEALQDYPGELPLWGAWEEARQIRSDLAAEGVLQADDAIYLQAMTDHVDGRIAQYDLPVYPIHGDAHYENVMNTARGLLWFDWEDCFLGPHEWDLACMLRQSRVFDLHRERGPRALAAFGDGMQAEVLDTLVIARDLQAVSWGMLHARQYDDVAERVASRVERMRKHAAQMGLAA